MPPTLCLSKKNKHIISTFTPDPPDITMQSWKCMNSPKLKRFSKTSSAVFTPHRLHHLIPHMSCPQSAACRSAPRYTREPQMGPPRYPGPLSAGPQACSDTSAEDQFAFVGPVPRRSPCHFKEPRQSVLAEMRSGAGASQRVSRV